ncbi:hypothetical protein DFH09DRAFT_1377710 [Mycena vulgaris]|nr:hypothetical protein DFH09DRAFT_1377710 [Mycena vulgaris]
MVRERPPCGIPLVWPVPDFYVSFPFQLLDNKDDCLPFSFPFIGPPPEELFVLAKTCLKLDAQRFDGVPCDECARMAEFVARTAVIAAEDIPDVPYRRMSHKQLCNVYKAQGIDMDRLEYISFNWSGLYNVLEGRKLAAEALAHIRPRS